MRLLGRNSVDIRRNHNVGRGYEKVNDKVGETWRSHPPPFPLAFHHWHSSLPPSPREELDERHPLRSQSPGLNPQKEFSKHEKIPLLPPPPSLSARAPAAGQLERRNAPQRAAEAGAFQRRRLPCSSVVFCQVGFSLLLIPIPFVVLCWRHITTASLCKHNLVEAKSFDIVGRFQHLLK